MLDTEKLRNAINNYLLSSKPTSGSANTPATVGDINKVIQHTANLFNTFIDELEQE